MTVYVMPFLDQENKVEYLFQTGPKFKLKELRQLRDTGYGQRIIKSVIRIDFEQIEPTFVERKPW